MVRLIKVKMNNSKKENYISLLKKVWHDPVWSKVISWGIIGLIVIIFGIISFLYTKIIDLIYENLDKCPYALIIILIAIIIRDNIKILRLKKQLITKSEYGKLWLEKNHNDYPFLLWFIIRKTLKTENIDSMYMRTLSPIPHLKDRPKIRELINRQVLTLKPERIGAYSFEIDKNCYDCIEVCWKEYLKTDKENAEKAENTLKQTPFQYLNFQDL